ncbi:MAG: response regulator [Elusimicrobia bacterium]|nr:response regulator [Elusimicrobiota bacterium]
MTEKIAEILLVEDDEGDVDLIKEALKESKLHIRLNVVDDGEKAMACLRRQGEYSGISRPDLILLDLNLPKKDGREVLRELKGDSALRCIPVVVLTTSDADTDVRNVYDLGANCYVTKPVGFAQFSRIVQAIEDFWFTVVKLPT